MRGYEGDGGLAHERREHGGVVLQVCTNAGEVLNKGDLQAGEEALVGNTRELEDAGGVHGAGGEDDFFLCEGAHKGGAGFGGVLHADCLLVLKDDAGDGLFGDEVVVGTVGLDGLVVPGARGGAGLGFGIYGGGEEHGAEGFAVGGVFGRRDPKAVVGCVEQFYITVSAVILYLLMAKETHS